MPCLQEVQQRHVGEQQHVLGDPARARLHQAGLPGAVVTAGSGPKPFPQQQLPEEGSHGTEVEAASECPDPVYDVWPCVIVTRPQLNCPLPLFLDWRIETADSIN